MDTGQFLHTVCRLSAYRHLFPEPVSNNGIQLHTKFRNNMKIVFLRTHVNLVAHCQNRYFFNNQYFMNYIDAYPQNDKGE